MVGESQDCDFHEYPDTGDLIIYCILQNVKWTRLSVRTPRHGASSNTGVSTRLLNNSLLFAFGIGSTTSFNAAFNDWSKVVRFMAALRYTAQQKSDSLQGVYATGYLLQKRMDIIIQNITKIKMKNEKWIRKNVWNGISRSGGLKNTNVWKYFRL